MTERFPYRRAPGLDAPEPRHPVVVVGAGPVGLTLALDLAQRGVPVTLLDDHDRVSTGSRAICWSKRSLEIWDRVGLAAPMIARGVTWRVGRTYLGERELFVQNLQPEPGDAMPAFINLQQYHVERMLVEAALARGVDLRVLNRVTAVEPAGRLTVETPEGTYRLEADWIVACDGARSPIRGMLGLPFEGEGFEERFLIADIAMEADFPPERRFWFAPPFHDGQSALLHKQPDGIWRIDLQLGPGADSEAERRPDAVIPRIERIVGHRDFRLEWVSVYAFQCRRLERFVRDRVLFCGDSAHVVSPFGARGGNGGLQDADALGWRLAAVVRDEADAAVLADYDRERVFAADENIRHSSRATRFMTPEDGAERTCRDTVLALAGRAPFARALVNSGRLSRPCVYPLEDAASDFPIGEASGAERGSALADASGLPDESRPGAVAPDAPQGEGWLLPLIGTGVTLMALGCTAPALEGAARLEPELNETMRARYLGSAPAALYLLRPDGVVAARWAADPGPTALAAALDRIWARAPAGAPRRSPAARRRERCR